MIASVRILELSSDASRRAAENPHSAHGDPVRTYVDYVLTRKRFCFITTLRRKRTLFDWLRGQARKSPTIIDDLDVAISRCQEFTRLAGSGFALVIASKEGIDETAHFLGALGYTKSCEKIFADVTTSGFFRAAWNRKSLLAALNVVMAVPHGVLCVFGHDGDPAYLLAASSNRGGASMFGSDFLTRVDP